MQCNIELIKREAALDALRELPHHLRLDSPPGRLNGGEALNCLGSTRCLEDRVRVRRELLSPQPPRLLKGQGGVRGRVSPEEIAIAEMPLQTTDFMYHAALLLGLRQFLSQGSGQATTAIADHHAHALHIEP